MVAGRLVNGLKIDLTAVFRITDLLGNFIDTVTLPGSEVGTIGFCYGVIVGSSKVYIVGNDGLKGACLWMTDLNGNLITSSPIFLESSDGQNGGTAYKIELSSTQAYIVGTDAHGNAAMWITSLAGEGASVVNLPTTSGVFGGNAYTIALSSSAAYIGGVNADNHAALWISNLDGIANNAIILSQAIFSGATGIALSPSQVFVLGSYGFVGNAFFWITDLSGNVTSASPIELPQGIGGRGLAISLSYVAPPQSLTGKQVVNKLPFQKEYINKLEWTESPSAEVISYNVYRNGDLIASVSSHSYMDRAINRKQRYTYSVTSTNANMVESLPISISMD